MAENIKYQINGQLADNTVTVDNKEDMILVPVNIGSANEARIIAEMKAEDSGLREETIKHVFELEKRVIKRLLMSGYSVNTGLYYASVSFRGIVENSQWNPAKNSIVVNFNVGADLRQAIKNTTVGIIGEKGSAMFVTGVQDAATRAQDASATAGRAFTLTGGKLKIAGTDPSVGITLTDLFRYGNKNNGRPLCRERPVPTDVHHPRRPCRRHVRTESDDAILRFRF